MIRFYTNLPAEECIRLLESHLSGDRFISPNSEPHKQYTGKIRGGSFTILRRKSKSGSLVPQAEGRKIFTLTPCFYGVLWEESEDLTFITGDVRLSIVDLMTFAVPLGVIFLVAALLTYQQPTDLFLPAGIYGLLILLGRYIPLRDDQGLVSFLTSVLQAERMGQG